MHWERRAAGDAEQALLPADGALDRVLVIIDEIATVDRAYASCQADAAELIMINVIALERRGSVVGDLDASSAPFVYAVAAQYRVRFG